MARRQLAFAQSVPIPSKKQRAQRRRRAAAAVAAAEARRSVSEWSELELAFFASAPPDEPDPAPPPESFDDLTGPAPQRPSWLAALGRAVAAAGAALRRLLIPLRP
jgi:hypothetical protein